MQEWSRSSFGHETPLDQLYEKAKLDGALVFYSGGPAAPHENRAKEFMQKYPGIAVSLTGGFSNVLIERIEKQMADRKLEVDMAFFQTVQDFVSWKKQGRLLAFKPEGFDHPSATVVGEPTRRDLQRPKSSHEFMPSCTIGLKMVTSVLISTPPLLTGEPV